MFSDEIQEVITLPSSWRVERYVNDASCQTRDLKYLEVSTQSSYKSEIEIQTEDEESSDQKSLKVVEDNSQTLANFMLRVYPDISEQLIANENSHAFDGYDVNWENETDTITCAYKLSHNAVKGELEVTSVTWNSRGSVIAAAYGRHDHESWCTHRPVLCTWNIDMTNIDTEKADKTLENDSCLMTIAFHPENPPLIAGGTFNGEVVIWDLSLDDDNVIVDSSRQKELHQEPVTKVVWLNDTSKSRIRKFKLISISCDGKTYQWEYDPISRKLKLDKGFLLLAEKIPKSMRPTKLRGDAEMGVTCVSFSKDDPDVFVMGAEGGGVFKCSMESSSITSKGNSQSSVDLRSPVTLAFQPHFGPVYSVDCSPFHRNVFVSCGTDTTANVYSLLQVKPLSTLEPGAGYLFNAQWSMKRPLVLFLSTEDGKLLIYDLKVNHSKPSHVLDVNTDKKPVYAMELNPKRSKLVATGDANGDICIWSLNDDLVNFNQKEVSLLDNMASVMLD